MVSGRGTFVGTMVDSYLKINDSVIVIVDGE